MYQILCDGYPLHDNQIENLKVINPICNLEINKTGSLTFQMQPSHLYYNVIKKHTSEIELYQDNELLFCGRVLNDEMDVDCVKYIECEGELAYLLDSIQRPQKYTLSGKKSEIIKDYLTTIINIHNEQVIIVDEKNQVIDDRKEFVVGDVIFNDDIDNNDVIDDNDNITLENVSNYKDTLTTITENLINVYGGHIIIRHNNGKRYIDYVDEFTNTCNQQIEFGKNIIDITKYIKGEDICTAIIPLGKSISNGDSELENRLTISDIPYETNENIVKEKDYIYDSEAVFRWGYIWKVVTYDNIEDGQTLLSVAKDELKNYINENLVVEMTAIDLHLLNVNIERIKVCDMIKCYSKQHNLNNILVVKSMKIDIDNPSNTSIQLVSPNNKLYTEQSISSKNKDNDDKLKDNDDKLNNLDNKLNTNYPDYKTFNDYKDWANNNFMSSSGNLSAYALKSEVNSAFNELATLLQEV